MQPADCLSAHTVFCMWTGTNPMSTDRIQALFSIFNHVHCPVAYLNSASYRTWQLDDAPFHPAFEYLSETHKSDYLRVYLMHHHGGGYTDIKHTQRSWRPHFEALIRSDKWCLGYTEIGPKGVAPVGGALQDELAAHHDQLIGLCAFIFRKQTPLTQAWMDQTHALLDAKHDSLRQHPARHPQDRQGASFSDGSVSPYPLQWTELLGNIFHPLIYRFRDQVLHADIAPSFSQYR